MAVRKVDVLGVGCCTADFLGVVPRFPRPDEKMKLKEFTSQGGGLTGTALVALSRLGASTRFIGRIGDDALGHGVLEGLKAEGVDTSRMKVVRGASARFAFIMADPRTGERTILWDQSQHPKTRPEDVKREDIASARILHVDPTELVGPMHAARIAREVGVTVSVDAEVLEPGVKKLIDLANIVIIPAELGRELSGKHSLSQAAEAIYKKHGGMIVLTAGKNGCHCVSEGGSFYMPAFRVKVKDSTGAGDVFHGAFLYGILQKWDLRYTARFASAVAALKCRALGGRAGIPRRLEVERFLARNRYRRCADES